MSVKLSSDLAKTIGLLEDDVQKQTFTAWALANNSIIANAFYADEASLHTDGQRQYRTPYLQYFDLASLSKLLFINTLFRIAFRQDLNAFLEPVENLISEENPVGQHLAQSFKNLPARLSVLDLLNHVTGFKAWFWFGRGAWAFSSPTLAKAQLMGIPGKDKELRCHKTLIDHAFQTKSENCDCVYSDVNYYLLARIYENLKTQPFSGWQDTMQLLNQTLGTHFFHGAISQELTRKAIPYYPYTITDRVDQGDDRMLAEFGPLHDTNSSILANFESKIISGQAGLFGTAADVVHAIKWLSASQAELRSKLPEQKGRFQFGCDTPTSESSSAAVSFPTPNDIHIGGFLGYTGTMAWFKLEKEILTQTDILLTNRTAHRTRYGSQKVPRIMVLADLKTNQTQYFKKFEQKEWHPITQEDAEEDILFFGTSGTKVWNTAELRTPPNILQLRQTVSHYNWNL